MPYIKQWERSLFNEEITVLATKLKSYSKDDLRKRPGYLNYCLTKLFTEVYGDSMKYADHNELVGMLECCKQEWIRIMTSPYEDLKIQENGKV